MNYLFLILTLLFTSSASPEELKKEHLSIPKQSEESVSANVGQPLLLSPPASLNFLSLAASAPASPDSKSGRLLGRNRFFRLFRYISQLSL